MADSALFTQLAGLQKSVQQSLGTLVKVTLHQAIQNDIDPVTGKLSFTDVIVDARIEGIASIKIGPLKDVPSDSLTITIYDPPIKVTEDDYITWNNTRYKVLKVSGLVKNATGERYIYKCKVGSSAR